MKSRREVEEQTLSWLTSAGAKTAELPHSAPRPALTSSSLEQVLQDRVQAHAEWLQYKQRTIQGVHS